MKHWSDEWVGIPYSLVNCAELAVRVQSEVFGKTLYMPVDTGFRNRAESMISDYGHRTGKPEDGDACVMTHAEGSKWHVGTTCLIKGKIWVLHSIVGPGSIRTRPKDLDRLGLLIEGYYTWI